MAEELIYLLGMVGLLRTFYYAIGEPNNEFNAGAIFACYTVFLMRLRAEQEGINLYISFGETTDKEELLTNRRIRSEMVVNRMIRFAGWANALGMCPICTGVWWLAATVLMPALIFNEPMYAVQMYGVALLLNKIVFKWT
jgi:hypothetical protein